MGIDRSKMPPQLQDLLSKLEASGVKFEIGSLEDLLKSGPASSAPSGDKKDDCDCPACTLRKKIEKGYQPTETDFATIENLQAKRLGLGIPPSLMRVLDAQASKLADKLVVSVQAIVEPLRNELQRQVEINDANMERINGLIQRLAALELSAVRTNTRDEIWARLADLEERHRKQVGLLHKRVTKRKGEVADVKVRVATTRGRVTRVEKKLT